ncbi:3-oxoacyl-ACP reductase [Roseateles terrae]|uniref:3-oxoacyl-[acyl-carrier protein] reductase n=1 Tax=Roseateles terrae TaxID=431060 RepID=A0ABR6GMM2_9BURK|nr:3-oxoacyl-ACP reductase [Roseateles terrae]MBB3193300.1 3-oxoacyl-[acyl-carrier protein] reductase [Roseateles terrae]OWQ89494.1 3-oxoacyl-ACP reductase [Roseateles terrae]
MTDRLLQLTQHPWGRQLLTTLGLPQPRRLPRRDGPFMPEELAGRPVHLIGIGDAPLLSVLTQTVSAEGATLVKDAQSAASTLIVDATAVATLEQLRDVFRQVQASQARLNTGARVLIFAARPETAGNARASALAQALQGFVRAMAKEMGRRGATVNLLHIDRGTQPLLSGALRFFGGDRSAYVSGQVLHWRSDAAALHMPDVAPARRLAVVTGAAGGIGAATARRLNADGFRVLCVDVPAASDALQTLAAQIQGEALPLDLTAESTPAALTAAVAAHGLLDLMVHNAGITRDRTLSRMSAAEWDAVMSVNLAAILAMDEALDAQSLWRDGAREVCLSSISGLAGNAGQTNYSASKAGVIGYVAHRAREWREQGRTINAVAPGFIETAMTRRMPMMIREAGRRLNALKQGGQPEDVAEAIAFLASPQAQPLSGAVLRVCGQSLIGA